MNEQAIKILFSILSEVGIQIYRVWQGKPVDPVQLEKKVAKVRTIADKWRARQ